MSFEQDIQIRLFMI